MAQCAARCGDIGLCLLWLWLEALARPTRWGYLAGVMLRHGADSCTLELTDRRGVERTARVQAQARVWISSPRS